MNEDKTNFNSSVPVNVDFPKVVEVLQYYGVQAIGVDNLMDI